MYITKQKFVLSDGEKIYDAFWYGTYENGWCCPIFTRKQMVEWLDELGYKYEFKITGDEWDGNPCVLIYDGNAEDSPTILESFPVFWTENDLTIGIYECYEITGYEFMFSK